MVCVKEIMRTHLHEIEDLIHSHHVNLISLLEVYKLQTTLHAILEYTVISLDQIIAIPPRLEEPHISNIYCQVLCIIPDSNELAHISYIFEGMIHLSRYCLTLEKLHASYILFSDKWPC